MGNTSKLSKQIHAELVALAKNGRIVPRAIWQWARRNKRSALYTQYQWDLQKSAEAHWDEISKKLLARYVTVQVTTKKHVFESVMYVRDPRAHVNQPGLIALTSNQVEQRDAHEIMLAELERIQSAIERARKIATVLDQKYPGTSTRLETLLDGVVDVQRAMAA